MLAGTQLPAAMRDLCSEQAAGAAAWLPPLMLPEQAPWKPGLTGSWGASCLPDEDITDQVEHLNAALATLHPSLSVQITPPVLPLGFLLQCRTRRKPVANDLVGGCLLFLGVKKCFELSPCNKVPQSFLCFA